MSGLLVNDYSQRNPPSLGEAMSGLLGNWGGNIEQGLLSAFPVLAENDPYKIGQQLLREGAGVGGIAWHASPHKWVHPDLSKMGTGEGAQAYGHGFYSAEARGVGEDYRKRLNRENAEYEADRFINDNSLRDIGDLDSIRNSWTFTKDLANSGGDVLGAVERAYRISGTRPINDGTAKSYLKFLDNVKSKVSSGDLPPNVDIPGGYLYKMNIPDETIDKMLDWDKPLREQTSSVQSVLDRFKQRDVEGISELTDLPIDIEDFTGKDLYRWTTSAGLEGLLPGLPVEMNRALAPKELASEYLNSLGIPGIKYLDGMSRAAGQGSRNFVSFTPDHIEMLERNGIPMKGLLGE
jgi:hypothetical protein